MLCGKALISVARREPVKWAGLQGELDGLPRKLDGNGEATAHGWLRAATVAIAYRLE